MSFVPLQSTRPSLTEIGNALTMNSSKSSLRNRLILQPVDQSKSASELADCFNKVITDSLDELSSTVERTVRYRPDHPFYEEVSSHLLRSFERIVGLKDPYEPTYQSPSSSISF